MKKIKILFISSEVAPFAKTGGLADVSYSLPKALKELGNEVRIMMPKYRMINDRRYVLREVIRLKEIPVSVGGVDRKINVKSAFTPDQDKIQVYFIDSRPYFGREGLYVDPQTNTDYQDNDERFILFSKSVLATLKLLFWQPDVIHCNDWQTALVPFLIKTLYKDDEFFKKVVTVLTVHNVGYQGNFPPESFHKLDIDNRLFKPGSKTEYYGQFSFLKAGIYYADYITTVSEQYAKEVQTSEEYGFGFEGVFRERSAVFSGIINGIDYSVWNPETDTLIPYHYTLSDISNKVNDKKALAKRFKLPFKEKVPIIGIISRLTIQKGFDLLEKIAPDLTKFDIQVVVLGAGEKKYQNLFKELNKKYPNKIGLSLSFDENLAHLIEAGSDMFLMPSRYEPCGLNQLYSLKYGTVPIVRRTGGLSDTIIEFNPEDCTGTGFVFDEYEATKLLKAIQRAVSLYKDTKLWKKLMRNGMKQDFSWSTSAKQYLKIYEKILKK